MKTGKAQRVLALVGLVLMVASIVCMMIGMFVPTAKDLLLSISFIGFVGAAGVLLYLSILRKRTSEAPEE